MSDISYPTPDPSWILREAIRLTVVYSEPNAGYSYLVERITKTDLRGQDAMVLSLDSNNHLYFNGQFLDVGDDFMSYISIIDEFMRVGASDASPELGYTAISVPYDTEGK